MSPRIPTEELLINLQDVASSLGKTPSVPEYNEHELSEFGTRTYHTRFGGWNKAIKAAGLDPNQRMNISKDELLTNLQTVASDLGKTPSASEYRSHKLADFSVTPFRRRFGRWNKAVRAADLEPNDGPDISTKELLTNLQTVASDLGKTPSQSEYENHELSDFSHTTYKRRFGGWNKAVRAADLEPNDGPDISTKELLNNLRTIASDLGKTPTATEYQKHKLSEAATTTYKDRFGSWWRGVVAAGCQPIDQRPLQPATLNQYFQTATDLPPKEALPPLLFLFTGLPTSVAQHLSSEWLQSKRDRNIVRVPSKYTVIERPWLFRIPDEWENPYNTVTEPTHLPDILEWVTNNCSEVPLSEGGLYNHCLRVAQTSDISQNRKSRRYKIVNRAPIVRPSDLRVTHGVNLARQGIDRSIIKRRLGIDYTETDLKPEYFMLWVYVNEGYEHPDFSPPSVVLDPDTGEPRYS